jgi:AmmeMemoRadiSam system protein B
MPILLFMAILKEQGYAGKGQLLMHYTSGDVLGDYKNSVSYASMMFH